MDRVPRPLAAPGARPGLAVPCPVAPVARRAPGTALAALAAATLALAAGSARAAPAAEPAEIVVCPVGCAERSVAAAIRRAPPGGRVRVRGGTYREGSLVVDRPLALVGEDAPVLDGEGHHEVVVVRADDVTIRGFAVRRSGRSLTRDLAAIRVEGARGCLIEQNRIVDAFFGIYLADTRACTVRDNEVRGEARSEALSGNAIHVWKAAGLRVEGNRVSGHRDGLYTEFADDSALDGNASEGNLRYGLHVMFSRGIAVRDNVLRANGAGVAVMYSREALLAGNRFEASWGGASYGLLFKDVGDSRVAGNVFRRNTVALYADGASRTEVTANEFTRNGVALRVLGNVTELAFTGNRVAANAFDVTTNSTRSENTFSGNYWGEYAGYDLDRDGRGDVPYRPVRLFALLAESYPEALILLRSPLGALLDLAERLIPVLTPAAIADDRPLLRPPR